MVVELTVLRTAIIKIGDVPQGRVTVSYYFGGRFDHWRLVWEGERLLS